MLRESLKLHSRGVESRTKNDFLDAISRRISFFLTDFLAISHPDRKNIRTPTLCTCSALVPIPLTLLCSRDSSNVLYRNKITARFLVSRERQARGIHYNCP